MKKVFISLSVIVVLILAILVFFPQVLYSFPFGQKVLMKMEGDQVAEFFFKEKSTTKDTLFMKGVIYSNTHKDIKKVLSSNDQITTLVMIDVPGSIDDEVNLKASKEIRKYGINTYIPKNGMVASGGTDMFLAGQKREAHLSAKLGVHSWSGGDSVALDFPQNHTEHEKYLKYYEDMNIPADFYWYTLKAAPADSIHWMTSQEMKKYRVLTQETSELLEIQKRLSSDEFQGRRTGNNDKAQELIRSHFKSNNLEMFNNTYNMPFTFEYRRTKSVQKGNNIVGYIKGKTNTNQYIVIGAHYDHLGTIDGTVYNGADDNASGTSALLYLAKYFSKNAPDHNMIFVAFDAEELGLHGSKYFVKNPPILQSQIRMNFNFDMISRNPKNEIYVVGTYPYPQFKPLIEAVAKESTLTISYGHDDPNDKTKDYWMNSSDNGPFFKANIPTITFSEEDHPGYHKPSDDFEDINPKFYQNVVELIKNSILKIDQNFPN